MLKNITLSADANLIKLAREKASSKHETLNSAFRKWLLDYTRNEIKSLIYVRIMKDLDYVDAGKHFTRDELNER